jgi:hypothetical protein
MESENLKRSYDIEKLGLDGGIILIRITNYWGADWINLASGRI